MEQIVSNIAGNIARCGCPFSRTMERLTLREVVKHRFIFISIASGNYIPFQKSNRISDLCDNAIKFLLCVMFLLMLIDKKMKNLIISYR